MVLRLTKNEASRCKENTHSLNTVPSTSGAFFLSTFHGFAHHSATANVPSYIIPMALNVAANPIFGNNILAIVGYTSPPIVLPHATIPVTSGNLHLKYIVDSVISGETNSPYPSPIHTPCASRICQCVFAKLVENVPRTTSKAPVKMVRRKYPASIRYSKTMPVKQSRKMAIGPTQATPPPRKERVVT